MCKVFATSDLHLMHQREFLYEPRGFSSIEEHDEVIIKNWNEVVADEDIVILLGDVYMGTDHERAAELINKLNGNILYIRGNHDTDNKVDNILSCCPRVELIGYASPFKYNGYNFYLSHYPCLVSNYDKEKPLKKRVLNLCGHSHAQDRWQDWGKGLIYHVELDCHNNYPKLLDEIIEEIKEKINE